MCLGSCYGTQICFQVGSNQICSLLVEVVIAGSFPPLSLFGRKTPHRTTKNKLWYDQHNWPFMLSLIAHTFQKKKRKKTTTKIHTVHDNRQRKLRYALMTTSVQIDD